MIKKPGKMRWDYHGKATATKGVAISRSFISDGKHFRFYEPSFKKKVADDRFQLDEERVKDYRRVAN